MRIAVVGGGGREHALVWKLAQNPTVEKIWALPGNAGIEELAECAPADITDPAALAAFAERHGVDLTVVGPEGPLVVGVADEFQARGLPIFGPSRAAARLEGSKSFAKRIMQAASVPSGRAKVFTEVAPALGFVRELGGRAVVKADGLAAGKGVIICDGESSARAALEDCLEHRIFGAAGDRVLVEEVLEGPEVSVFCLSDGKAVLPLVEAQDFKRVGDGNAGPNTGGMGSYSPVPVFSEDLAARVRWEVLEPTVAAMEAEGCRYAGLLYAGLMLTADGPKVLEFNARFGDPETQAVIPRLATDLAELLLACVEGNLTNYRPKWSPEAAVTVVMASGGYPGRYETGSPIRGLKAAGALEDVQVFHAGTRREGGEIVTSGGRVLGVSALGSDLAEARDTAYEAVKRISFDGCHYRMDIAEAAARG
ncbi:MAG: phosphoribosylamine--glycine ligase [Actinomycetota bacterium]